MSIRLLCMALAVCALGGCEPRDEAEPPLTPAEPETRTGDFEKEAEEALERAEDAVERAGDRAREMKDEYVASMRDTLNETDEYIESLETQLAAESAAVQEAMSEARLDLKSKRDTFASELDNIRDASAESWEQLRDGAANATADLREAVERSRERLAEAREDANAPT